MKLIVGLGNEGKNFVKTRHNIGFMVLDKIVKKLNIKFKKKLEFNGLLAEKFIKNEKILFLKPLTFMNLSGESVIKVVNYYKINIEKILIIYDDFDLYLGTSKFKAKGRSGGHNGIENIINCFKTNQISRLKIGIQEKKLKIFKTIEKKSFVLSRFNKKKFEIINKELDKNIEGIFVFIKEGIQEAMNFNNKKQNDKNID